MPPANAPTAPQTDFYRIPALYDALHTPGTAEEVTGLQRIHRRFGAGGKPALRWLEPACGTARYLRVAARRGLRVTGFDASEPMIRYAKVRFAALRIRGNLLVADMASFARSMPSKSDFAFCLINTIRHLPSDAALATHLDHMRRALTPGAVYAVGLNFGGFENRQPLEFPSEDTWTARRGRLHVHQFVQYLPPPSPSGPAARTERVISHLTATRGDRTPEHIESTYTLRTYTRPQWHAAIARAGWSELAVVDEDGADVQDRDLGYAIRIIAPT